MQMDVLSSEASCSHQFFLPCLRVSLNPCVPLRTEFNMTKRKCLACGEYFKPWPQTPDQSYCSKPECQRERRRRTKQKERSSKPIASPPQHSGRSTDSQNYSKRNQPQQKQRLPHRRLAATTIHYPPLPPGLYLLTRLDGDKIVKGNEWIAEIRILSAFPGDG
jgi:hypothetical protein